MKFQIFYYPKAQKFLERLRDRVLQRRLMEAIDVLAENPHPSGSVKMEGVESRYRIRVGDYRVIYQIEGSRAVILVVTIGHRREIYR